MYKVHFSAFLKSLFTACFHRFIHYRQKSINRTFFPSCQPYQRLDFFLRQIYATQKFQHLFHLPVLIDCQSIHFYSPVSFGCTRVKCQIICYRLDIMSKHKLFSLLSRLDIMSKRAIYPFLFLITSGHYVQTHHFCTIFHQFQCTFIAHKMHIFLVLLRLARYASCVHTDAHQRIILGCPCKGKLP